VMFRSHKISMQ